MDNTTEFRTSSFCGTNACVEFATTSEQVLIRDGKDNGKGSTLTFTKDEWTAFLAGARNGEFDVA